jgi:hypothetical protein
VWIKEMKKDRTRKYKCANLLAVFALLQHLARLEVVDIQLALCELL